MDGNSHFLMAIGRIADALLARGRSDPMNPTHRSHDMTDKLREALERIAKGQYDGLEVSHYSASASRQIARAALAAAPQPAPEQGMTRAEVGQMLDAKRHDLEALVEVIRQVHHIDRDHSEMPALYRAIADALLARGLRLPGGEAMTDAARDVLAERQRQISAEGWTPANDDRHENGDLASAAACYIINVCEGGDPEGEGRPPFGWPWDAEWWKPTDPRRDLVKAGALILAEIERLDRAAIRVVEGGDVAA